MNIFLQSGLLFLLSHSNVYNNEYPHRHPKNMKTNCTLAGDVPSLQFLRYWEKTEGEDTDHENCFRVFG